VGEGSEEGLARRERKGREREAVGDELQGERTGGKDRTGKAGWTAHQIMGSIIHPLGIQRLSLVRWRDERCSLRAMRLLHQVEADYRQASERNLDERTARVEQSGVAALVCTRRRT
jgi:hypothetical protein